MCQYWHLVPSRAYAPRNGSFSLEKLIRFITHDHGTVTLQVTWKSRWHKLRDQRRVPATDRSARTL
jgi:hypothetical protein